MKHLVRVTGLKKHFPITKGFLRRRVGTVKAVDGIDFDIRRGETLGLVGESGCGKTTTGRLLIRLYQPTAGSIVYQADGEARDVATMEGQQLRDYRRRIQIVFQDPYTSLNPRLTVSQIVGEPLLCLTDLPDKERTRRVTDLLEVVGLDPRYANRYPHAFSGGQRQRIGIARALAVSPELIVADEAVSALDASIQAQVINLLKDLQREYGLAYLFITHDLAVVHYIADRVAVMYVGQIVELAGKEELFFSPRHPYTEALLSSVPQPDPSVELKRIVMKGDVADPANRPRGCPFHPRCNYALAVCSQETPPLVNTGSDGEEEHLVACHRAEELSLRGVQAAE